jgi:hypothetical protein
VLVVIFASTVALLALFDFFGVRAYSVNLWKLANRHWDLVKPTEIWTSLNGSLTLIALLVGAWVGYVRFARRREMHARCELALDAHVVKIADGQALSVTATATNAGSYQLTFPEGSHQLVSVSAADKTMWDEVVLHGGQMLWSMADFDEQEMLEVEGERDDKFLLEPGQRMTRSLLFPVAAQTAVAFRVLMYVQACPRWIATVRPVQNWSTETVLVPNGEEA